MTGVEQPPAFPIVDDGDLRSDGGAADLVDFFQKFAFAFDRLENPRFFGPDVIDDRAVELFLSAAPFPELEV